MGYFFKKIESQDKIIFELKTKNLYIFTAIIFLSLIPAILITGRYFTDNVNLFRIPYIAAILIAYAVLDGKAILKVAFSKNRTRKGSVFSFKGPVRHIILK